MALTNYAELQTAVAAFLNRDDLTAIIPTFIDLAEAQIQREARSWRMETRTAITLDAQYVDLPSDWVETIRLASLSTGYRDLRLVSSAEMERMRAEASDATGTPQYYCLTGGQIEIYPTPDTSYTGEIVYIQRIPTIVSNANWVITYEPDLYLYGALLQSAPYLVEDARIAVWGSLYNAAMAGINIQSDAAKSSGSGLVMKGRK
jgi:hypothetical protein